MIKKETVERILETARIEEVVGDFVHLKKRGTSMIGLCPFHGEKTPSFHVSPAKGIYKCFGCGEGGDSLQFVMSHEKYSYPEALRYLANKYNIEVEEIEVSDEYKAEADKRESLYITTAYAAKFFADKLWNTDEGRSIGLSYFKERGFKEDILKKFEIGYSPEEWTSLYDSATAEGYKQEFLEETGLVIKNDKGSVYDRFRTRVIFPIHNFTGRIIGFGGRTLKTDKKIPKYVNSPESEIYYKSKVLYGLFHAKKAIRERDNCLLVEGYADVLSVHQAGVENVVASSGTSLTTEQIKLIGRFTNNVTILYDGDAAGIKASLRGLDMILEEGLNVKVVLFPDGHDPDSYIQTFGASAFKTHVELNTKDFIFYKTEILLQDAANDPIKKAGVIRDVIESIAKIPDAIKASVYVRECSSLLQMEEQILISELNKIRLAKSKKEAPNQPGSNFPPPEFYEEGPPPDLFDDNRQSIQEDLPQEKEMIRILLSYGHHLVNWDDITDTYIGPYIVMNLNDVTFTNAALDKILKYYIQEVEKGTLPLEKDFLQHQDREISSMAISLLTSPYNLSENWYNMHNITVKNESDHLKSTVMGAIFHLKKKKVLALMAEKQREMQQEQDEANLMILVKNYMELKEVEKYISNYLGTVVSH
ncbi:DNA primase [Pseudopedobacter saltans DSM 12145]|uniref:DNA primase n=1 Tax=Pseudopedobacter saltans (strain ATCC 51119 / DSM 12145 / JCM 21818 / CCUG 39354 / LMG 10337 / NBRC 100064 / NCIMB 13643) TaxID=762903 RepID=F0S6A9_PSESL|nr:DNA primase [Pseudopedobacter saltans]ADY53223.1 DNA primase [Pseudopedobacter saltans DSM 12145]